MWHAPTAEFFVYFLIDGFIVLQKDRLLPALREWLPRYIAVCRAIANWRYEPLRSAIIVANGDTVPKELRTEF